MLALLALLALLGHSPARRAADRADMTLAPYFVVAGS
jgi:hypothetical protein